MGIWKNVRTRVLVPAILAAMLVVGSKAEAACINWSDARGIIAKNGLLKPGAVRSRAIRGGGEVVSINLCRNGGRYVYRMTVIGKKNRVQDITVDAKSGAKISSRSSGYSGKRKDTRGGRGKGKRQNRIINRVKRNLRRHGIKYF